MAAAPAPAAGAGVAAGAMPTTDAERTAAAIAQSCLLLSGNNDTEKFAGLLLLTKHIPAPGTGPEGAVLRARVLDSMGTKFLKRLLKMGARARRQAPDPAEVGGAAAGTGAGAGTPEAFMYEQLALNVMTVFCNDDALAAQFAGMLPLVLAAVRARDDLVQRGVDVELSPVRDAGACVAGILRAKCRIPVRCCWCFVRRSVADVRRPRS